MMRRVVLAALSLGVWAYSPSLAEAACYMDCCWTCLPQTVGCGAGCSSVCSLGAGQGCICEDENYGGNPCCKQCITYGFCIEMGSQPGIDAKTRLAAILSSSPARIDRSSTRRRSRPAGNKQTRR